MIVFCRYTTLNDVLAKKQNISHNVHISFDDVELVFDEQASRLAKLSSRMFVGYLKYLQKKFGAKFTLFAYGKVVKEDIVKCVWYKKIDNKDWIKFGYHGYDADENGTIDDITSAYNIYRQMGREEACSQYCRLHKFEGTREMLNKLNIYGVKYMLCSDKGNVSYDLSTDETLLVNNGTIIEKGACAYIKTDMRLENANFSTKLLIQEAQKKNTLFIFSHEWCFCLSSWKEIKRIMQKVRCWFNLYTLCKYGSSQNYNYLV